MTENMQERCASFLCAAALNLHKYSHFCAVIVMSYSFSINLFQRLRVVSGFWNGASDLFFDNLTAQKFLLFFGKFS